jgi:hypothetical protein
MEKLIKKLCILIMLMPTFAFAAFESGEVVPTETTVQIVKFVEIK